MVNGMLLILLLGVSFVPPGTVTSPRLYVFPQTVAQDDTVWFVGTGFSPNKDAFLFLPQPSGALLSLPITANANGVLKGYANMSGITPRQYETYALDTKLGRSNTVTVTVTAAPTCGQNPSIAVYPSTVTVGHSITVVGSGFCSGAKVIIKIAVPSGNLDVTAFANPLGYVDQAVAINESIPFGQRNLWVVDGSSRVPSNIVTTTVSSTSFDFSLSNTGGIRVEQGWNNTNIVTATLTGRTSHVASLSCTSGLPPGASCSFSPSAGNVTFSSTLTISVADSTPAGNYTVTVTGNAPDASLAQTTRFTLTVIGKINPISCAALPATIYSGQRSRWEITDPTTCNAYLLHQGDVDVYFPILDLYLRWLNAHVGTTQYMPNPLVMELTQPNSLIYGVNGVLYMPVNAFYIGTMQVGVYSGYAYVLPIHESVNAYTGETVSAGWPYDWWVDHKSPFPLVLGMEGCMAIDFAQAATACQNNLLAHSSDRLVLMFESLYATYGPSMFGRAFISARSDGIDWTKIDGGANPSPLLTNYVAAYLTLGARADLSPIIGARDTKVQYYTDQMVAEILQARSNLQNISRSDYRWSQYLQGNYAPSLTLASTDYGTSAVYSAMVSTTWPVEVFTRDMLASFPKLPLTDQFS
jgi:hypothetical protein